MSAETSLNPKALGAARKRLERMMHTRGYMGRGRVTISGMGMAPVLSAREVAAEIVTAYLAAIPASPPDHPAAGEHE